MNTQLPNCIPATLHCTPIEPCPTINPPCHGGQQAQAQTAATVCTQFGCQTHVYATNCPPATVCAQPTTLCPPPQQAGGAQQVPFTFHCLPPTINCPPQQAFGAPGTAATVCTQFHCPPPTLDCPQQQAFGAQGTAATVCTQFNCPQQAGPTPTATFYPGCHTHVCPAPQQAGNWPTPQTRCFICGPTVGCPQAGGAAVNTQMPQCQPYTTLCIWTVNQGPCHQG